MYQFIRSLAGVVAAFWPALALAHTGTGDVAGFSHGFVHPLTGMDHVLAMVAVGLFAAQFGGRALWLVPLSFVSVMTAAGVLGMAGVDVPFVQTGIAASVIVLGIAIAMRLNLPTLAVMALVGFFAIFHGHAHGTEMPETASGLAYGVGFGFATALLHAVGIGTGRLIGKVGRAFGDRVTRIGGGAMALAGAGILAGYI